MLKRSAANVLAIAKGLDAGDVMFTGALVLIAAGMVHVWLPGAYLVPGVALLWISMPTRRAFIDRPAPPPPRKGA